MMSDSQLGSQWNKQESQFMRMTGNVVRSIPASIRVERKLTECPDARWRAQQHDDEILAWAAT